MCQEALHAPGRYPGKSFGGWELGPMPSTASTVAPGLATSVRAACWIPGGCPPGLDEVPVGISDVPHNPWVASYLELPFYYGVPSLVPYSVDLGG